MIQVENPLAVLTQDTAKLFLSNSTPQDKYGLFLRGTGLRQLQDDYVNINKMVEETRRVVDVKQKVNHFDAVSNHQAIPELKEELETLQSKWDDLEATKDLETKCGQLKDMLIWARIQELEAELVTRQKSFQKSQRRIENANGAVKEHKAQLKAVEGKQAQLHQLLMDNESDFPRLNGRMTETRMEISNAQGQLRDLQNEERDMHRSMQTHKRLSEDLAARIEAETKRIEGST